VSVHRQIFGDVGSGPVYGRGDEPLEQAKDELLSLLRQRGARSAEIVYDGGYDEGLITALRLSDEPLGGEPTEWTDLAGASDLDVDSAYDNPETPDGKLLEAATNVMCDKWGSFAGEFEVKGRLLVDVDGGRIVRRDAFSVEEGPKETEIETL
jgi:hypothetical protein